MAIGDSMEDKDGYIYISVLIILLISLLLISEFMEIIVNRRILVNSKFNQLKAFNSSESKILQVIEKDYYRDNNIVPYIQERLKSRVYGKSNFNIKDSDLLNGDENRLVELEFEADLNKKVTPNHFFIKVKSKVNDSNNRLIGDITIANNIFTMEEALIVNSKGLNISKDLQKFFMDFNNENLIFEADNKFLSIKDRDADMFEIFKDENKDLILLKDSQKYVYLEEKYIRLFAMNENKTNIYIEKYEDIEGLISLSGIIYVEGNLIIKNNFDFKGIIIVKNGRIILEDGIGFNNRGLIISNNKHVLDDYMNVELEYDRETIFIMAPYLPGYINLKIKNIREE